jgi:SAM-dependent methyltransferase
MREWYANSRRRNENPAVTDERETRRATFDAAADRYDRARPEYPGALFDELCRRTGLAAGDRVLEVGCASGKATRPLASRGLRLTCIELGPALVAAARRNLAGFADVEVIQADFETWLPAAATPYAAVVAATSWHWVDPAVRYHRAWELLRPGGHLAFWTAMHVLPPTGDPFFEEIQTIYDEIGESLGPRVWPRPREIGDDRGEILSSCLFDLVSVTQFDWQLSYDAERYIDLLETFSGHMAMAPWQRERLYAEIRRRLALRPDGLVRRHWGAVLHVARRIERPL